MMDLSYGEDISSQRLTYQLGARTMFPLLDLFKLNRHSWRERNRERDGDACHTHIVFWGDGREKEQKVAVQDRPRTNPEYYFVLLGAG